MSIFASAGNGSSAASTSRLLAITRILAVTRAPPARLFRRGIEGGVRRHRFVGVFGFEPHLRHFGAGELEARIAALDAGGVEAAFLEDGAPGALHQQHAGATRAV